MMFDICDMYVYSWVGGNCVFVFVFVVVMRFDICDVYFWGGGDCVVKDDWIVHHGPLPM